MGERRRQRLLEAVLRAWALGKFDLGSREVAGRRYDGQARNGSPAQDFIEWCALEQPVTARHALRLRDAEAGAGVSLRVEVEEQHRAPGSGERRAQIDGGGGLADAALLVRDRDDPRPRRLGA